MQTKLSFTEISIPCLLHFDVMCTEPQWMDFTELGTSLQDVSLLLAHVA